MAILTNPQPNIYSNLYENTGSGDDLEGVEGDVFMGAAAVGNSTPPFIFTGSCQSQTA